VQKAVLEKTGRKKSCVEKKKNSAVPQGKGTSGKPTRPKTEAMIQWQIRL